jgi:hypothetical protein
LSCVNYCILLPDRKGSFIGQLFLSLVKGTMDVLLGLTESLVLLLQFSSLFNTFCSTSETILGNLPLMMIAISSGNPIEYYPASFRSHSSSSTVRFHSRGDKTPPCGQPLTLATCMFSPIRLDIIHLLLRMDAIHIWKRGGTPCLSSSELTALIEVLSKAPSISRKAPKAISWVWSALSMVQLCISWFPR